MHVIFVIRDIQRIRHAIAKTIELIISIFLKKCKQNCGRGDNEDMHIFSN